MMMMQQMMMAVGVLTAYVVISDDEDNGDNEKDGNGWPAIPKMEMTNVTYPVPAVLQYKRCK